jgi:hypothetical protein
VNPVDLRFDETKQLNQIGVVLMKGLKDVRRHEDLLPRRDGLSNSPDTLRVRLGAALIEINRFWSP